MKVYMINLKTSEFNDAGWDPAEKLLGRVFRTRIAAEKFVEQADVEKYRARSEDGTPELEIVQVELEGEELTNGGIFFEESE